MKLKVSKYGHTCEVRGCSSKFDVYIDGELINSGCYMSVAPLNEAYAEYKLDLRFGPVRRIIFSGVDADKQPPFNRLCKVFERNRVRHSRRCPRGHGFVIEGLELSLVEIVRLGLQANVRFKVYDWLAPLNIYLNRGGFDGDVKAEELEQAYKAVVVGIRR